MPASDLTEAEQVGRRLRATAAGIARTHAENAENAGDFVGANNTRLANRLYQASADLKEYARRLENGEPLDP